MKPDKKLLYAMRKTVRAENKKYGHKLERIPKDDWPAETPPPGLAQVWRSRSHLVQVYVQTYGENKQVIRLSFAKTDIDSQGRWQDGISWDELQDMKCQIGYAEMDAVEIYPPAGDVVNVANMRHLFIMPQPLEFAWRKTPDAD